MNVLDILEELKKIANPEKAHFMTKYMRNQFEFLGIYSQERKEFSKKIIKLKNDKIIDWNFIQALWDNPYRELQYIALDYLNYQKNLLVYYNLEKNLKPDYIHKFVGIIALKYPEQKKLILKWSLDKNIWLRRIAIDHQIGLKEKTDTELLNKILINNFNEKEFFIAKAIGWSLRDYAKTNPNWVLEFLNTYKNQMQKLSVREAKKRLVIK